MYAFKQSTSVFPSYTIANMVQNGNHIPVTMANMRQNVTLQYGAKIDSYLWDKT